LLILKGDVIIVEAIKAALRLSSASVAVAGTAGPLNDRNSRERGSYYPRVWGIISANIRPGSIYLGKHFPDAALSGKSHEVILMDGRAHAGFLMPHAVERAANDGNWIAILLHAGHRCSLRPCEAAE
jgi:hypothetical protein